MPGRAPGQHPGQPRTPAEMLRAAADFIESSGLRSGVIRHVPATGKVRIHVSAHTGTRPPGTRSSPGWPRSSAAPSGRTTNVTITAADLRADGAIGGVHAVVETTSSCGGPERAPGVGQPLAEAARRPDHRVPGKLPEGWRWVTELDTTQKRQAPRQPRRMADPGDARRQGPEARRPRLPAADQRGTPGIWPRACRANGAAQRGSAPRVTAVLRSPARCPARERPDSDSASPQPPGRDQRHRERRDTADERIRGNGPRSLPALAARKLCGDHGPGELLHRSRRPGRPGDLRVCGPRCAPSPGTRRARTTSPGSGG